MSTIQVNIILQEFLLWYQYFPGSKGIQNEQECMICSIARTLEFYVEITVAILYALLTFDYKSMISNGEHPIYWLK